MTLAGLARLLDGKVVRGGVVAPMPWRSFSQVRVVLSHQAPDGFYAISNLPGGPSTRECRKYVLGKVRGVL